MTNTSRQPKGIRVGGQFAATAHPEPDLALSGDTGDDPAYDFLGENEGKGGLPPGSGGGGGGGDDDEAKERKESRASSPPLKYGVSRYSQAVPARA